MPIQLTVLVASLVLVLAINILSMVTGSNLHELIRSKQLDLSLILLAMII